ncbi:MAG: hypothetical protein HFG54_05805 [Lachnospiraceae bacterium]|nr:hypothetical protein [Lachnospiraceae bacterium]
MKRYLQKVSVICLSILMVIMSIMPAYAQVRNLSEDISAKEYSNEEAVGIEVSPRGQLISTVTLELSDQGYRTLGIYSRLQCHEEMKKIITTVILQKSEGSGWTEVHRKKVEWSKEDYPDDDLSMTIVSYNLRGLEPGTYRLKGNYSVFEMYGSLQEFKTVTTSGFEVR